jgi:putative tryptophan/tyrosine transport system substrate-binding protein
MKRREFIAGLGGAVAWPMAARGQQDLRMRRVGNLVTSEENDQVFQTYGKATRDEMAKFGWVEGRNLRVDTVYAGRDVDRMRAGAAKLVNLGPDVILTGSVPGTIAVQQQTQVIPIVFQAVADPIASGIVKNIARPEGNATGITNMFPSIAGKWVELLKDAAPQIKRVGLLYNAQVSFMGYFPSMEEAASALAVQAMRIPYRDAVEMVRGVDTFAAGPNGALIVVPPSPSIEGRKIIYSLAVSHRLPTMYVDRSYVVEGGLMSYAASNLDSARRSAYFVDRILRGAKVSEMPVELPTKFELAINVKTAKSMGLTIPESFLLLADEVIE